MIDEKIQAHVLSVHLIANADPALLRALKAPKTVHSLGLLTADSDDVAYVALDEATKKADVKVLYARSLYAGASNASTRLAGEFLGILAGETPAQVQAGLNAAIDCIKQDAAFRKADEEGTVVYFAHCISRCGSYLARQAKCPEGTAMAYLIAPPLEAMVGLDRAMKEAAVELNVFYGPPTETNFAGGLLTGEQAACQAACEAFGKTVKNIAQNPIQTVR